MEQERRESEEDMERIKKVLLTNSDADFYSGFKALKRYFSLTVIISFALTGLTFLISFIIGFATAMQEIH
jgi:phosphoribosyl 1,2-cyclic phosphodiesterase